MCWHGDKLYELDSLKSHAVFLLQVCGLQLLWSGGCLTLAALLWCSRLNTLPGFNFPFDFLISFIPSFWSSDKRCRDYTLSNNAWDYVSFLTFAVQGCIQKFILFSFSDYSEEWKKRAAFFRREYESLWPLSPAHRTSAHPDPGCRWSGSSGQWGTPAPPSAGPPPPAPPRSTRFLWATRELRWITFKRPQLQIWSMILVSFTKQNKTKKHPQGADLV